MKRLAQVLTLSVWVLAAVPAGGDSVWGRSLPWREAGLSEHEAAAHLLDRFAYGARPGEVEDVVALGLGNWIEGQLNGDLPGAVLSAKLAQFSALELDHRAMIDQYSFSKSYLAQQAMAAGVMAEADFRGDNGEQRRRDAEAALQQFAMRRGHSPETRLLQQLQRQKVMRAVFSESQLVEVLTDFWFNHFNVSSSDGQARVHLLAYERDAIRPHVLGPFRDLLQATARHPAMLTYLGNYRSVANPQVTTTFDLEVRDLDRLSPLDNPSLRQELAKALGWVSPESRRRTGNQPRGLNENYARELLELHTLGVGGGYSQRDVIEVARALTGWTTFPSGASRARIEAALDSTTAKNMGFVVDGEFVFRSDLHDSETKSVLGATLPAGRGIEDGEDVLDLVVQHPSTARHLMTKLVVRLVSEQPPRALVHHLAEVWEVSGGDLTEVILSLVESPEFWSPSARRSKIKTPFEFTVSAIRALGADVTDADHIVRWNRRMGQNLYAYSAPTGFPDRGERWTHVGPLLARINYGLYLATGRMKGTEVDLLNLLGRRRLESLEEAIAIYFPLLMPQRNPLRTLELVGAEPAPATDELPPEKLLLDPANDPVAARATNQFSVQAVGILLSSPEFQVH